MSQVPALNLVSNPTWKKSVLISAKTAESLISSQRAVLLAPFMVSQQGVACVETGTESLSWNNERLAYKMHVYQSYIVYTRPVQSYICEV